MHTINDIPKQYWKDGALVEYTEEERQQLIVEWNADAQRIKQLDALKYQRDRAAEYPPVTDYLDGLVKGDQEQIDKYIADCLAVKAKYPKEQA
jgi:YD repeat-containing protein